MKTLRQFLTSALVAALCFALSPFQAVAAEKQTAIDKLQARFTTVFKKLPNAEVPAKAGELLDDASAKDKQDTAFAILRVIATLNPAAQGLVVGALVESEPDLALAISNEASRLLPAMSAEIKQSAGLAVETAKKKKKEKDHYKKPKKDKP